VDRNGDDIGAQRDDLRDARQELPPGLAANLPDPGAHGPVGPNEVAQLRLVVPAEGDVAHVLEATGFEHGPVEVVDEVVEVGRDELGGIARQDQTEPVDFGRRRRRPHARHHPEDHRRQRGKMAEPTQWHLLTNLRRSWRHARFERRRIIGTPAQRNGGDGAGAFFGRALA
jgi:hypothetical protein